MVSSTSKVSFRLCFVMVHNIRIYGNCSKKFFIQPSSSEFYDVFVSQNLKLLSYFFFDMLILRMFAFKLFFKRIHLFNGKFIFRYFIYAV